LPKKSKPAYFTFKGVIKQAFIKKSVLFMPLPEDA